MQSNTSKQCRSQWPGGVKRWSEATRLLGLRVRIPPGAWMSVSVVCYQVEFFCNGPITRTEEVLPSVVCLSVITERQQSGLLPLGAVKP